MIATDRKNDGFMFCPKDVLQRGMYIPPFGKTAKHTFGATFTTGKPDVSRVFQNGVFAKHTKRQNIPRRVRALMEGNAALR